MKDKFVFWGVDDLGKEMLLGVPMEIELKKDNGAANQLTVSFVATSVWSNIRTMTGYYENDVIFSGIIDEQSWEMTDNGYIIEFIARNKKALLLDNEVMPQVIYNPSLSIISRRFLEPLGFTVESGNLISMSGELSISKGTSAYQVLEDFCETYLGTYPIITEDGKIYCGENPFEKHHNISRVETLKVVESNYDIISQYYGKNSLSGAYTARYTNPYANGITRVRYIDDASNIDFTVSREVTATINGFININVYDTVTMDYGIVMARVESVTYTMDDNGRTTKIVLKEAKQDVDF